MFFFFVSFLTTCTMRNTSYYMKRKNLTDSGLNKQVFVFTEPKIFKVREPLLFIQLQKCYQDPSILFFFTWPIYQPQWDNFLMLYTLSCKALALVSSIVSLFKAGKRKAGMGTSCHILNKEGKNSTCHFFICLTGQKLVTQTIVAKRSLGKQLFSWKLCTKEYNQNGGGGKYR